MTRIRIIFSLAAVAVFFMLFAGSAALDHRWRDATEGAVPAAFLIGIAGFMTYRTFRGR